MPNHQASCLISGHRNLSIAAGRGAMDKRRDSAQQSFSQAHNGVARAHEQVVALRDEAHRGDLFFIAANGLLLLARFEVPALDDVVGAAACQRFAICPPGNIKHMVRVALEDAYHPPRLDTEDLGEAIGGSSGEILSVGRKLQGNNRVAVGV